MELRRFGKPTTIIEGLKLNKKSLLELSRKMKKKFATGGGTVDGDTLLLQGYHRERPPSCYAKRVSPKAP